MKKLALLAALAALIPTMASAMPVEFYEKQLQIVPRYHAHTIEKDVDRVQGRAALTIQLVGATTEQTFALLASHEMKFQHNMTAIRSHVNCVETPEQCGNKSWKPHQ